MSTNSFSFPPPPPPPPQAAYAESTPFSNSFRGRGDKRWERGSRGRGRGTGHRGSRGGNHSYGPNPSTSASGIQDHHGSNYPLPNYPPVQQPQYSVDPRNPYGTSPPSYAPVASPPVQQQTYPYYSPPFHVAQPQAASYQYGPPNYTPHVPQYPYQLPPSEHTQHPNNRYASPPVNLGPPMRMGFGATETHQAPHDHFNPSDSRPPHRQRGGRGSHSRRSNSSGVGTSINSRGNESTTRPTNVSATHGTQVAPAVPRFGNPLPVKPPAPQIETKKAKKKKKRRVNQLGLTPKAVEHASSSEEEDDIDEELKLAATVTAASTAPRLQFTYKGQMSTLQSPDEIASWLEERKKHFPTAARKAEKEERLRKSREEQEEKKRAERLLERQKRTLEKDRQAIQQDKQDSAAKAKLKVEKLRKRLEKEERRVAKSEAKSRKRSAAEVDEEPSPEAKRLKREGSTGAGESAPVVAESAASHNLDERSKGGPEADSSNPIQDPLTPTSQPAIPDSEVKSEFKLEQPSSGSKVLQLSVTDRSAPQTNIKSEEPQNETVDTMESADSPSASSDNTSEDDDEDDTSSSGSSSSDSESDVEAPEMATSRPQGPQRVKPPKRVDKQTKAVCRDFLQTGRCRRGRRCRWRHALPEREHRKAETETPFRVERKSLHQRLVEQELEKERQEKNKQDQHGNQTHHDTQIKEE